MISTKLVRIIVTHILHQLSIWLVIRQLAQFCLVLAGVPVHYQMRIVVEYYGWNYVAWTQIPNEIRHCMTSYFPLMTMHRPTDVQRKQYSVVLLHGYLHLLHLLEFGVEVTSITQPEVLSNSLKNIMQVSMCNILVLTMNSGSRN